MMFRFKVKTNLLTFSSSKTVKILLGVCFWPAVPPGVDNVEPVEPVTVVQGSLVTLTCEAHGVPPPTLTWMKDGQPLSLHRNLLLDGEETRLQLPDVTPSDEGLYSCVASNQAGSSTKSFNLTVFGKNCLFELLSIQKSWCKLIKYWVETFCCLM